MQNNAKKYANRNKIIILIAGMCFLVVLYLLGGVTERGRESSAATTEANAVNDKQLMPLMMTWFDEEATPGDDAQIIDLSGMSEELLIDRQGDFVISGATDKGIRINAPDSNVHLFLNGADIKSGNGPAISCLEANKLLITLVDKSVNVVSDFAAYENEEMDAAIYSESDVSINGNGKLIVDGLYKDAIHSKDVIKIGSGEVALTSVRYGLNGKDGVSISGGNVDISSKKDGIRTSGYGENGIGSVLVSDGDISIISGRNGIKTEKGSLYVYGGRVFINGVSGMMDIAGDIDVKEGCINE